ncbi:MAG: hypothetical protein AAB505_00905 [Patescibacteria group bacterium]
MKYKNTLQKGKVRFIVFREDGVWYGAGLEFNIVVDGESREEVVNNLFSAITGYINSARKIKSRPHILNQVTDSEYENLWFKLNNNKPIPSPYQEISFGTQLLANA